MAQPTPRYVTTASGQVRIWQAGEGPDLVVLPGLIQSAEGVAARTAAACPGMRVTALELPGIGGSAGIDPAGAGRCADALAEALRWTGNAVAAVIGFDLSAPLAALLAERLGGTAAFGIATDLAAGWQRAGIRPPDLEPRQDGTHLQALWSFLRDRHLLMADNPGQPATGGDAIPDAASLSTTFNAAAVRPDRFASLWTLCLSLPLPAAMPTTDLANLLGQLEPAGRPMPDTQPEPASALTDGRIWHEDILTRRGWLHLRRSGAGGRPVLVIPTGGGSSSQFAPVVQGLAEGRAAFSVDYPGNGLSGKWTDRPTIESLAEDMLALLDAMGLETVDIWGSHTGALVGLELAILAPERVGRLVMEGPVFISADFQADLLENYFPPIRPDKWGMHIPLIWNWRRDLFMFWPWYRVERAAARQLGVPDAWQLHNYAIGILQSGETYDGAYRAAFSYDTRKRLPLLTRPALICAGPNDMLKNALDEAGDFAPPGLVDIRETPTTVWWPDPDPAAAAQSLQLYRDFLDG
ncbi:alpha/beta hydrolase [Zhengella mangrovi]|uniref:Alpha/beta hydrolase n=1 Tax=Zhengella mangrovi TaxID=1982044 RepID=A0A2G1QIH8_9HYPH|nr:alpha/beta hydrolase [Zhengella mangrovi]PHP65289.1 alpha/beta hydrolase [Zhengella mangrovi]